MNIHELVVGRRYEVCDDGVRCDGQHDHLVVLLRSTEYRAGSVDHWMAPTLVKELVVVEYLPDRLPESRRRWLERMPGCHPADMEGLYSPSRGGFVVTLLPKRLLRATV